MDLRELDTNITIDHWYYQSKFLAAKDLLIRSATWPSNSKEKVVLGDIGAGSGLFTKAFHEEFPIPNKTAYAVDLFYPDDMIGNVNGVKFVREIPQGVCPSHLLLMDILEHIEDDLDLLKKYVDMSIPGSVFVITVPAHRALWSDHDEFLDHKRRYTLPEIEQVAIDSGLEITKSRYFFAAILPIVFIARKIYEPVLKYLKIYKYQGMKQPNLVVDFLLKKLLKVEISLGRANRFVGLTCMVVAKKQG